MTKARNQAQLLRKSNTKTVGPQSMQQKPGTIRPTSPNIPITGSTKAPTKPPKTGLLR